MVHPVGANFQELSNFIRLKKGKWYFEEQFNYLVYGETIGSINYGGDMFMSYQNRDGDYDHLVGQGETHHIIYNGLKASYSIMVGDELESVY